VTPDDAYYDPDPPVPYQQGDLLMDVPLLASPLSLTVLRTPSSRRSLTTVPHGEVEAFPELALGDAFDQNQEYVAALAERVVAAIVTHTCNLDGFDAWLMAPVKTFEGDEQQRVHLWKLEYPSSFPVQASVPTGLPESYIDLSDIRSVDKRSLSAGTRICSMTSPTQREFGDHIAKLFGRAWGEPAGTPAPRDGFYRCNADNLYYNLPVEPKMIEVKAGNPLPECENCVKRHKSAQWYPLTKYKKR